MHGGAYDTCLAVGIFMCKSCDTYVIEVRMINSRRLLESCEENIGKMWFSQLILGAHVSLSNKVKKIFPALPGQDILFINL